MIPVRLLNELDDGKVVFFCGAGVSMGPGSELPSFAGLVEHVYSENHIEIDVVERQAWETGALDKTLGLLERDIRLGTHALRRTVIKQLSVSPSGELNVHKALIDLSRNEHGVRLITTNFDDRFVEAGLDTELVDAAPMLPLPKPHTWSSLVHLHGRIVPNEGGENLVLTAADFGRAYLTERWAARFVTELFREFIVVFVGYRVGDPVMSYLVDALAAERSMGARFTAAYAFAESDGSEVGDLKARDAWRAKNVEPILYDRRENHRLLEETLIEWARVRSDPFHARARIAINEMARMPAGPDDPIVERVVWALEDPVAAKALADARPVEDEDEYVKLETWLDMFANKGLLSCGPDEFNSNGSEGSGTVVSLVDDGYRSLNPVNLDMTRVWLSVWLARHLHVPQLLGWVLRNGGQFHPRLRQEVERKLAAEDLDIPPRLRLLWTVLLDNRPTDPRMGQWMSGRYKAATTDGERRRIEDEAIDNIAPCLVVHPGPASRLTFRQYVEKNPRPLSPIETCGHLKLVSGDDNGRRRVGEILQDTDLMSRHAETLTGHLERAVDLGEEDDKVYTNSILYRPSIAAHGQNRDRDSWTHLIDLVRDSYVALSRREPKRAANLLLRWIESRKPLFKRLALHALVENPKSDIRLARYLLLKGRKPGLWEIELHREVMRFLRRAGNRLPRSLRVEFVRAIHDGPRWKKNLDSYGSPERLRYEKALRLKKLRDSGAQLNKKARALADEAVVEREGGDAERDEFLTWHDELRRIGVEEFAPRKLVDGSVADVVAALEEEKVEEDELRGLVSLGRVKVASALRRLAGQGKWPPLYWQGFLWHLASPRGERKLPSGLRRHVARVLGEAPDRLFGAVGSAAGEFMNRLAEEYGTDREDEFRSLWTKVWQGKPTVEAETVDLEDSVSVASNHAAGRLAEAALVRLGKYEPHAGAGIPGPVRPYFDAIGKDLGGDLGRVMLAMRLHYMYAIDPDWTGEHLITRLCPGQSQEAANLWSAYGWSPSLGPDLLRAFKCAFLEFLQSREQGGRKLGNLRSLFVAVCLEAPEELTEQEILSVVETLPEEGLRTVLGSLRRRFAGEPAERDRIWREMVHPWLRDYWPQAATRNTAVTSEAILGLVVECGNAFPEAAEWSLVYLQSTKGRGLFWLRESGHAARHPESMLRVLVRVVDADVLEGYEKDTLQEVLDALVGTNAEMAGDPRFRRLYRIATQ